jgi:formate hydrogenlyase subunit 5
MSDAPAPTGRSALEAIASAYDGRVAIHLDDARRTAHLACGPDQLSSLAGRLTQELAYAFATLVAEYGGEGGRHLTYVFYGDADPTWVWLEPLLPSGAASVPSLSGLAVGPSVDWHEREVEDLFGLTFQGHPRLGEFVLHEDWPEGVNPMRPGFDPRRNDHHREPLPDWAPPTIVTAPGAFAMPIGPVFSDFAESAHFLLETVGEDVIRTIPRFFYKYRGVEKLAEGRRPEDVLLLAERFSGSAAFAHALAFCQAVETIAGSEPPPRARSLRTVFAELERSRHHAASISGICNSTALAVATSEAALIEEDLLRLAGEVARHRYFFGLATPGGLNLDLGVEQLQRILDVVEGVAVRLRDLRHALAHSNSFLDRLEEVGVLHTANARAYGAVGPVARAAGLAADIRRISPYAAYQTVRFSFPAEPQGDGYARLRVLFAEAEQSVEIVRQVLKALPPGPVLGEASAPRSGLALAAVEAPSGAAFHWLRLDDEGRVARYRVTPPSFANWHAFHLAAENFAFQDFPIILASFGLSNAECDR